jgi:pyruvate/2-oxoglutarate dehydrogenase complex dihydrolipoamide dehydrogenase (E3) component
LIIGSGIGSKLIAWTGEARCRTAIVERGLLCGSYPNVACLPSKNMIWSAKVISLMRRGLEFGLKTESMSVDILTHPTMSEGLNQLLAKVPAR